MLCVKPALEAWRCRPRGTVEDNGVAGEEADVVILK
jgi:hypothetical protein